MAPRRIALALILASGAALASAPAASADTLVVAVAGAKNLSISGGYAVWAQPDGAAWRLAVRSPDGTVSVPAIRSFRVAPDPSAGSTSPIGIGKRIVAVYPRCAGASTVRSCDIFQLDLATGRETKVRRLATRTYSETAAAISGGAYVVARRGGPRPGVVFVNSNGARRLSRSTRVREVAYGGTRVAVLEGTSTGRRVVVRRASGDGRAIIVSGLPSAARHLDATRYRASWAVFEDDGTHVFRTSAFRGRSTSVSVTEGERVLPAGTDGIGVTAIGHYVDYALTPSGLTNLFPDIRFVR